ncbi:hypothetical protein ACM5P9_005368, partial [Escherichia coli]
NVSDLVSDSLRAFSVIAPLYPGNWLRAIRFGKVYASSSLTPQLTGWLPSGCRNGIGHPVSDN